MDNYLKNVALSETGFLFDPGTGNTFILNETALVIVQSLQKNRDKEEIVSAISEEFDAPVEQIERDYSDLLSQLTEMGLWK